jgi:hypothetical protein
MPKPKFHLDDNMPHGVADGLRKRDRDCTTTQDAGLIFAADTEHMAYALSEGRVVVTRDDDFLALDAEGVQHAGIVYWTEKHHFGHLVKDLDSLCFDMTAEELMGRVVFL